VADADAGRAPAQGCAGCAAVRHLLAAVQQALSLPAPQRHSDRLLHLALLEQRVGIAVASMGRLLADPRSGELDFLSEGDHILHQIADLPPDSYRHQPD
jgi:hypothetical protein